MTVLRKNVTYIKQLHQPISLPHSTDFLFVYRGKWRRCSVTALSSLGRAFRIMPTTGFTVYLGLYNVIMTRTKTPNQRLERLLRPFLASGYQTFLLKLSQQTFSGCDKSVDG